MKIPDMALLCSRHRCLLQFESGTGKRGVADIDNGGSSVAVIASQRAPAGVILEEMVATTADIGDPDDERITEQGDHFAL